MQKVFLKIHMHIYIGMKISKYEAKGLVTAETCLCCGFLLLYEHHERLLDRQF
jgi:hypothetical protein